MISFSEASGFRRKSAVFHRRGRRQESLRMLWTGKKRKIKKMSMEKKNSRAKKSEN